MAPVYTEGASIVRVFLPMGTSWVHVWSGTVFKGQSVCGGGGGGDFLPS